MFIVKIRGQEDKGIVHLVKHPQSPIFTLCNPNTEIPSSVCKLTFDAPLMQVHDKCLEALKGTNSFTGAIHEIRREYQRALEGAASADPEFAIVWADLVAQQFEGKIPSAQEAFDKWFNER